jgi:hypothetical protein
MRQMPTTVGAEPTALAGLRSHRSSTVTYNPQAASAVQHQSRAPATRLAVSLSGKPTHDLAGSPECKGNGKAQKVAASVRKLGVQITSASVERFWSLDGVDQRQHQSTGGSLASVNMPDCVIVTTPSHNINGFAYPSAAPSLALQIKGFAAHCQKKGTTCLPEDPAERVGHGHTSISGMLSG